DGDLLAPHRVADVHFPGRHRALRARIELGGLHELALGQAVADFDGHGGISCGRLLGKARMIPSAPGYDARMSMARLRALAVIVAGPEAAFARALAAAQAMGWDIVDAQPKEGRIEATASTFWFGFKDDVVVRITPLPAGSRIDVRSKSRVGRGDTGTNAQRIRAYLKRLN